MNMKKDYENIERLIKMAPEVGGVFSLPELSSLFDESSYQALRMTIKKFQSAGLLQPYCRGVYTSKDFSPLILSAKVRSESYVSLGSALAFHRMIGTESPYLVSSITTGCAASFSGKVNLEYSTITNKLFFGFVPNGDGVKIATPEKAVLDTLYFYQHGKTYHFNIFQDIDYSQVSKKIFEEFLSKYQNPKFVEFAKDTVYGRI